MAELSKTEKAILELISNNPFIGQSNIAQELNLARSTIAVHITQLVSKGLLLGRGYILPTSQKVTCIGGVAFNRKYALNVAPVLGTSNPGVSSQSHGGVIRNIAENLARLDVDVSLISIVGEDESGRELLSQMRSLGVDISQVVLSNDRPTAEYVAIFDSANELVFGVASMEILDQITPAQIERSWSHISSSDWVVLDCNLPSETIEKILYLKQKADFKIAVDTVSISKAKRLPRDLSMIDILFTNRDEANSILNFGSDISGLDINELATLLRKLGSKGVVLTDGANGHIINIEEEVFATPALSSNVINVSGAGDALVAGFISKIRSGASVCEASKVGAALSALTIESEMDVRQDLSVDILNDYILQKIKD